MSTEKGFHRHGSNSSIAEFAQSEREVLLNLIEQLIELLSERVDHGHEDPLAALVGITSHDSPPEDEVLRRLLPNAYADEVDASEFRRYTESKVTSFCIKYPRSGAVRKAQASPTRTSATPRPS